MHLTPPLPTHHKGMPQNNKETQGNTLLPVFDPYIKPKYKDLHHRSHFYFLFLILFVNMYLQKIRSDDELGNM